MQIEPPTTDTQSFIEQLAAHRAMIYRYLTVLVSNRADAEELYQKTCVTMWEKWSTGTVPEYFGAWGRAIALNHARNLIRSRKNTPGLMTEELLDALAAQREQIDSGLSDRLHALRHCRAKLPNQHQEILQLYYGNRDSVDLIAIRIGRSKENIYKMLQRIRRKLLDCISRHEDREAN